eukprot:193006-Chlamydomonas_euryale.AAC.1
MPMWSSFSSAWSSGHTCVSADARCVVAAHAQNTHMGVAPGARPRNAAILVAAVGTSRLRNGLAQGACGAGACGVGACVVLVRVVLVRVVLVRVVL